MRGRTRVFAVVAASILAGWAIGTRRGQAMAGQPPGEAEKAVARKRDVHIRMSGLRQRDSIPTVSRAVR